ncbi:MAG: formylmethanofuran--tetrahydromethanopterin N-formyltransferase [Maioricimonas sp. JB049]
MLQLNGVTVADTFAEAFTMVGTRLIITAATDEWACTAGNEMCGYATSVIACDAEAAIEKTLLADETPDGRPGVSVLMFGFSREALAEAAASRVGQCVLTCPTTACYNGIPEFDREQAISIGGALRYFGDGYQFSKRLEGHRYWRVPVMDGEFLCEDRFGTIKGVAGGNLLFCGRSQAETLAATAAAVRAMRDVADIIMPFPGGIVRSGSKVGSQYPKLKASTNDAYCPTLRPLVSSELPEGTNAVYEIVVDGLSFERVESALRTGLHAACNEPGLTLVTAGNYGGKLGKHHFHLKSLL